MNGKILGRVASITAFDSEDEVLRLANDGWCLAARRRGGHRRIPGGQVLRRGCLRNAEGPIPPA
ncbi:hypothetical protein [Arthrobacter sp. PGP41]|uniref:hypothetical protein n=1 Tax=Arthrobacter sp. PGP41 TaxID=2079227 RepID=UPI001F3F69F3|nr:hypothetical protein [Arthrobacter sp. PGP41]